jgi:Zn-dependent protease
VAAALGVPVSAPVFIPFGGAFILQKRASSAWGQALIGIGGPIGGTIAALCCLALYYATGHLIFVGLAYVGAFINLFNLTPFAPLDGGWITGAISPRLWLVGAVVLGVMFLTGHLRNPFLLLLLLISIPRFWHAIRTGQASADGTVVSVPQRVIMGISYVSLCGFLAWMMSFTHAITDAARLR